MPTPEKQNQTVENSVEITQAAGEQLEQLMKTAERSAETTPESKEKQVESAKEKALEKAVSAEKSKKEKDQQSSRRKRHGTLTKKIKEQSFNRHMESVRHQLRAPERVFSAIIHNKVVEKTSEVVASTIARPNALLYGGISAFILVAIVYSLAKYFGYLLSGFETIGAFVIGWLLGILYDYLRVMITGKRS